MKEPWQMTRAEWKYADNKPKYDAIVSAINSGSPVQLSTQYRTISLARPEYIRITNGGTIQIARGRNWDSLVDNQVDSLATQAGFAIPSFEDRQYHHVIVEQAIAEGKPVPDEVLNDYPDLALLSGNDVFATPDMPEELSDNFAPEMDGEIPPVKGIKTYKTGKRKRKSGGSTGIGVFR